MHRDVKVTFDLLLNKQLCPQSSLLRVFLWCTTVRAQQLITAINFFYRRHFSPFKNVADILQNESLSSYF